MGKYENYKDSGIEWIGEIPVNWGLKKLNWCFETIGSGTTPKAGEKEYYQNGIHNWLLTGDLNDDEVLDTSKKITDKAIEDYSTLKEYPINSVVIAMYGATIGKLGILKIPTTVNQACCVFSEPIQCEHKFVFYNLLSARDEIINMSYGGGQPNISQAQLKQFRIQTPSLSEQTQITNYLDRKTTEIDQLIADKKALVELYKEEKTAIINQAVTKGINPDAKMKDSGIEWLGEIPQHWKVKKLKYVANIQTGRTPKISGSTINYFENGVVNWYTPGDFIKGKYLTTSKRALIKDAFINNQVELFKKNSIYLVSIGATLGKVSMSINEASANQQINVITFFNKEINPFYGYRFILGNAEMILNEADYTTLPILNQTKLNNIYIAVPSQNEQTKILEFIELESKRIDVKLERAKKYIDLLTEYRTVLISEVVTGKIKVTDDI